MRRYSLLTGLLATLVALALSGCNTIRGVGKDLERAGEAVQKSADKND
jgi:predicted small secreted protein